MAEDVEIARADREDEALAAAEAWKATQPEVTTHLEASDVLVDRLRKTSSIADRVRINLARVPPAMRPRAA